MKRKKSLRQLARELGVSASYLSQIRHGKRPASAKLLSNQDIMKLLNVKQNVDAKATTSYNKHVDNDAELCSGSTEDFGSSSPGSNPGSAALPDSSMVEWAAVNR